LPEPPPVSHSAKPPAQSTNRKIKLLLLCGLVAMCLIIFGLATESLEADHHALRWYERIGLILLSLSGDLWFIGKHADWPIIVGALLMRLLVLSAIIFAGWAIFARQIRAFSLSRQRGHVVVIGNTPTAREVVAYLASQKRRFIQVVATDAELTELPAARIALPFSFAAIARPIALAQAGRIILETGEITTNMALARAILHGLGDKVPPISCNIDASHIADEFTELLGIQRDILIYDEARLSVRDTLARHPLYASADRQAATRVHLLIVGFGRLGRVLLEEAVQDSVAGTLDKPFITIIDGDAKQKAQSFARDKPSYPMAVDIAFIESAALDGLRAEGDAEAAALFARDDAARVTAIAVCLDSDAEAVASAMALRGLRRRSGRLFAPLFIHMREPEAAGAVFLHADKDRIVDPFDSIIPIRLSREALAIEILAEGERDRIAKNIHAGYRHLAEDRQAANASWAALPETYRRANRHAADHLAAKLWSLGLASERHSTDSAIAVDAAWAQSLATHSEALERLARLEHDRWIADRVMEGWTVSNKRDDDLRHHPDLVAFDAISGKDQDKDRKQIAELSAFIAEATRATGERLRPEFVVALAAAPEIGQALVEAACSEIARCLAVPLADLAAHHVITIVSALAPGSEFAALEALVSTLEKSLKCNAEDADLRLIALEGVPYPILLKQEFKDAKMREHHMNGALVARRRLFARLSRVETVRIGPRGHSDDAIFRDPALAEEGRRRVNAYLARRADVLCVVATRDSDEQIAELIAWRSGEKPIPAELDSDPSRRGAPRVELGVERLIVIET
jgi:hypothetical protein